MKILEQYAFLHDFLVLQNDLLFYLERFLTIIIALYMIKIEQGITLKLRLLLLVGLQPQNYNKRNLSYTQMNSLLLWKLRNARLRRKICKRHVINLFLSMISMFITTFSAVDCMQFAFVRVSSHI